MDHLASITTLFTDRRGGVSAAPYDTFNLGGHVGDDPGSVAANRARLAAGLGVERVVWMEQVHGNQVAVVSSVDEAPTGVDAMVTAVPGLALGVLVADCVPVLMSDAGAGVVAAVHAGRLGTRCDVVLSALDAMVRLGADPARTDVLLGPAICGSCYEVPQQLHDDVVSVVPAASTTTSRGTPGLDLRRGLQARLSGRVRSVRLEGPCTRESGEHFSYRRGAVTGRFAGVVRFATHDRAGSTLLGNRRLLR